MFARFRVDGYFLKNGPVDLMQLLLSNLRGQFADHHFPFAKNLQGGNKSEYCERHDRLKPLGKKEMQEKSEMEHKKTLGLGRGHAICKYRLPFTYIYNVYNSFLTAPNSFYKMQSN
jgi:hypothetical protein